MKKLSAIILTAVLLLGLCACSGEQTETKTQQTGVFQAGFCRTVVNPTQSVPLSGYSNEKYRYSDELGYDLCTTALAVTDENDTTIIMIELDFVKVVDDLVTSVRKNICEATGVPESNIMISASHNHSSVALSYKGDTYVTNDYLPWLMEQVSQSGIDAYNDRKPATLYMGQIETESMNFVRHYTYINDNGERKYCSDNYGTLLLNDTTEHTKLADPTLYLLQFKREGEKDIVLANWRAHPHIMSSSSSTTMTADYPGAWAEAMRYALDCDFIFFQAAAGNVNTKSRIVAENRTTDGNVYAYLMTEYCKDCLNNNMEEVTDHTIQVRHTDLTEEADHSGDSLTVLAQQVVDYWNANSANVSATKEYAESLGLHSYYHATSILSKAKREATFTEPFDTVAIGSSLAMVFAPNELFDTNSEWLESQSPYKMTLTMGYSNAQGTYVPSAEAYEYGCYEADITRAAPGTGELIQETFLSMLQDMHG